MIKVYIQVAAGSRISNSYNEKTLEYKESREVSRPYPYPYGFILGTNAADGDNVDCYIITRDSLKPGTIVECEPFGLLEQNEGEEVDHKILASMPGQDVEISQALLQELQEFIYALFSRYPDMNVRVGPILPREAALSHIESCREV